MNIHFLLSITIAVSIVGLLCLILLACYRLLRIISILIFMCNRDHRLVLNIHLLLSIILVLISIIGCQGCGYAFHTLHPQLDWRNSGAVSALLAAGYGTRGHKRHQTGSNAVVSARLLIEINL